MASSSVIFPSQKWLAVSQPWATAGQPRKDTTGSRSYNTRLDPACRRRQSVGKGISLYWWLTSVVYATTTSLLIFLWAVLNYIFHSASITARVCKVFDNGERYLEDDSSQGSVPLQPVWGRNSSLGATPQLLHSLTHHSPEPVCHQGGWEVTSIQRLRRTQGRDGAFIWTGEDVIGCDICAKQQTFYCTKTCCSGAGDRDHSVCHHWCRLNCHNHLELR